jgi:hypothetical protein
MRGHCVSHCPRAHASAPWRWYLCSANALILISELKMPKNTIIMLFHISPTLNPIAEKYNIKNDTIANNSCLLFSSPPNPTSHSAQLFSLSLSHHFLRHGHGQAAAAAVVLQFDLILLSQAAQQVLLQDLQAVIHRVLHESSFPAIATATAAPPFSPSPTAAAVLRPRRPPAAPAPRLQHRQVRFPRRRAEAHRLAVAPPPATARGRRRSEAHRLAVAPPSATARGCRRSSPAAPPHHAPAPAADGDTVPPPPHPAAAAGRAAPGAHPGAGPLPASAAPGGLHVRGVAHLRLHAPAPRDALADQRSHVAAWVRLPSLAADAAITRRADAGHQPPRPRPVTPKQPTPPPMCRYGRV